MSNTKYELVLCIVNAGFSEIVMDSAKEVGARGGTVIHARGTANREAEQFFNITIQPDKEIVMLVVPSDIKDAVLHALYQGAGLKTAGQGIAFSLPVDDVVGLSTTPQHITKSDDLASKNAAKEAAEDSSAKAVSDDTSAKEIAVEDGVKTEKKK